MIARIQGTVVGKNDRSIIVDVGGVGYRVYVTTDTLSIAALQSTAALWTHLAVREDALELYGFVLEEELDFFMELLRVSGVGPRSALGIMSVAPVRTLRTAIASGDIGYLTKVSGIGKKTAEKIALELKDRLALLADEEAHEGIRNDSDALMALTALGYSTKDARDALKNIPSDITSTNDRIKEALRQLGTT